MISAREVRAPDRSLEKDVAHLGQPVPGMKKDQVPRRVTGTMQNLERFPPDVDVLPRLEPAVRLKLRHRRESEHPALLREGMDPKGIIGMRPPNRDAESLRHLRAGADMIQMTMGQ